VIRSGMRIPISHSVRPPSHPPFLPNLSLLISGWILIAVGQIGKILGERWKNMGEKDKQQYDAKATKDKERYEAEKRAYNVLASSRDVDSFTNKTIGLVYVDGSE
jgi:hypothetical protein